MSERKFRKIMSFIHISEFVSGVFMGFCYWFLLPKFYPEKALVIIFALLPIAVIIAVSFIGDRYESLIEKDLMMHMKDVDEEMDRLLGLKKKWYQKAGDDATQIQVGAVTKEETKEDD